MKRLACTAVVVLASCGPDAPPPVPVGGTRTPPAATSETRTQPGAAPRAVPIVAEPSSRGAALVGRWADAADDAATQAVVASIAASRDDIDALVAALSDSSAQVSRAARDLLRELGDAAIEPLLRAAAADGVNRDLAAQLLASLVPLWRDGALGAQCCRVLLDRARGGSGATSKLCLSALGRARPAVRSVIADLAALWRADPRETDALDVLRHAGPDAAEALPIAVAALDDPELALAAAGLVEAIGATSVQSDVARRLASPDARVRIAAATALASADPLAPEVAAAVAARISSDDETEATAAVRALLESSETAAVSWRDVARRAWSDELGDLDVDDEIARSPAYRDHVARGLAELGEREAIRAWNTLGGDVPDATLAALAGSPTPGLRLLALTPWEEDDGRRDAPPFLDSLLRDPDERVRVAAASVAAERGLRDVATLAPIALPFARSSDPVRRADAMSVLARCVPAHGEATTAVIETLSEDVLPGIVRGAAIRGLGTSDVPIPGSHAAAVAWIADALVGRGMPTEAARAVLRFDGGVSELVRSLRATIVRGADGPLRDAPWELVDALRVAGRRAAPLLDDLRPSRGDYVRAAIAAITGDIRDIAKDGPGDADACRRLLAAGAAGRALLPLFAASAEEATIEALLPMLAAERLDDDVLAAVRTAEGEEGGRVHEGALRLLPALTPSGAAAVLALLESGEHARASDVAWAARDLEIRAPGAVPLDLIRRLVAAAGEDDVAREPAYALVCRAGPRAVSLAPVLRERMARPRGVDPPWCALAISAVTGGAEPAASVIRAALRRPDAASVFFPWEEAMRALTAKPVSDEDAALLAAALGRTDVNDVRFEITRALPSIGTRAAPAVPALRDSLSTAMRWSSVHDPICGATIDVLAGLGPAAREAVPEIRRFLRGTGDPDGRCAAALARIDSR